MMIATIETSDDQALNALAALDDETHERVLAAGHEFYRAEQAWCRAWNHEHDHEQGDDGVAFPDEQPGYELFTVAIVGEIATAHKVSVACVEHAAYLMTFVEDGLAVLDQRRAELSAAQNLA
jgi:hypothetical protein